MGILQGTGIATRGVDAVRKVLMCAHSSDVHSSVGVAPPCTLCTGVHVSQQPLYSSFPADDLILLLQLAGQEDGKVENKYELSLMTSLTL